MISIKKIILIALIIFLYLGLLFFSIQNLFQADEIDFIKASKGILETGKPIYKADLLNKNFQGLWHPPLYIILLTIPQYFFGENPIALRSVAIICELFTIILIFLITDYLVKKRKLFWASFAAIIYTLNPLAVQSSIILDIDGSILNFLMALFVYLYIKNKSYWYLIPSLLLVFWSKFSGTVILCGALFIYTILTKNLKKFKQSITTIFSAGILFLITFFVYTKYYNLDFLMPLTRNPLIGNTLKIISGSFTNIAKSLWSIKLFLYFAIPFFIFLFCYLSYKFIKNKTYKTHKNIVLIALIPIISIIIFFIAGSSTWNFPKYYILTLPYISIFIGFMLSKIELRLDKNIYSFVIASLITLLYFFIFLGDPLIPEIQVFASKQYLMETIPRILMRFLSYVVVPLIIFSLITIKSKIKNKVILVLLFLTFTTAIYIDITQATADYSTHNLYGTTGLEEIINYFETNQIPSNQTAVYPNLGYYLGYNDYYDITQIYPDEDKIKKYLFEEKEIQYIVILKKDFDRIGRDNLNKYYKEDKAIGDYHILKRIN